MGKNYICLFLYNYTIKTAGKIRHKIGFTENVLFIGNSLTYTHNIPKLVENIAAERGLVVETKTIAYPNYAILDHWEDGLVQRQIKSRKYDYVIIQQGPSSQEEGYRMLVDYGAKYASLCEDNDAELAYYMVWPSIQLFHTFDGVIANYTSAAEINNAILCPVGKVWKDHIDETNDFSFYSSDQFHPSPKGSEVAATVIADSLFE